MASIQEIKLESKIAEIIAERLSGVSADLNFSAVINISQVLATDIMKEVKEVKL